MFLMNVIWVGHNLSHLFLEVKIPDGKDIVFQCNMYHMTPRICGVFNNLYITMIDIIINHGSYSQL